MTACECCLSELCLSELGLVSEVADSGKEHCETKAVGGVDDFLVALRAARLNDGGGAGFGDFFDAVGKGKECVGEFQSFKFSK